MRLYSFVPKYFSDIQCQKTFERYENKKGKADKNYMKVFLNEKSYVYLIFLHSFFKTKNFG